MRRCTTCESYYPHPHCPACQPPIEDDLPDAGDDSPTEAEPPTVGGSVIETAIALEDAKQRSEYWLNRWIHERHNVRFLIRYVRALRACDRLTTQLCTP